MQNCLLVILPYDISGVVLYFIISKSLRHIIIIWFWFWLEISLRCGLYSSASTDNAFEKQKKNIEIDPTIAPSSNKRIFRKSGALIAKSSVMNWRKQYIIIYAYSDPGNNVLQPSIKRKLEQGDFASSERWEFCQMDGERACTMRSVEGRSRHEHLLARCRHKAVCK